MKPVNRRKRWFEVDENPDQKWLPFDEYEPAKVIRIDTVRLGRGWLVECELRGRRYRGVYYLSRPNVTGDCILAIETYEKIRVGSEEPTSPFPNCQNAWNPCNSFSDVSESRRGSLPTRPNCFVVPCEIPTQLSEALALRHVRPRIEDTIAEVLGFENLDLDIETGLLYNDNGEVEAQVVDVQDRSGGSAVFRVRLNSNTWEDYMVPVRGPSTLDYFASFYNIPNEVLAS